MHGLMHRLVIRFDCFYGDSCRISQDMRIPLILLNCLGLNNNKLEMHPMDSIPQALIKTFIYELFLE